MTNGNDLRKINDKLIELLSSEKGYFGRVISWGQVSSKYIPIGYILSEDFIPTLTTMTVEQRKLLIDVMNYFEIHARPLKALLNYEEDYSYTWCAEIAWSHFATVIMFGMLELATKGGRGTRLKGDKGEQMKQFLENNLPQNKKDDIAQRYSVEDSFKSSAPIKTFSSVFDHLYEIIRCDFVHDIGLQSKGLEWNILSGAGTNKDPITFKKDVPMQEWLQITWQAILNSLGYKGVLELPSLKKQGISER